MKYAVAIADADGLWTDVSDKTVSVTRGSSNPSAVITECTVDFGFDFDNLGSLLDPRIGKGQKRIRVTIGDVTSYYLLEKGPAKVQYGLKNTSVSGRAYAGLLDDFAPLSYAWDSDVTASNLCNQVAHADVRNQGGEYIPVIWSATLNPLIPGGRYSVSKQRRREIIADVAAACNATVRTTLDGLCLEVVDINSLPLAGDPVRSISNMHTFNASDNLCTNPHNAVRVIGEVVEYTRATLPTVTVTLAPDSLLAGDSQNAEARAAVRDSAGNLVKHTGVVDEAITAGSYTEIPVSGCYSVQGVWLNSGSTDDPVRGPSVTPESFNASKIFVPDNGTQLFIASYTQATEVSWSVTDLADEIEGENTVLIGEYDVRTNYPVGSVRGVYLASDVNRIGTNFYTGGSFDINTNYITLGINPGPIGTRLLVDYDKYTGGGVDAAVSPSSSLCDSSGYAKTLVDPGTVAGMAVVEASALSVSGEGYLSISGAAIGSISLTAEPGILRARGTVSSVYDTSNETHPLKLDTSTSINRLYIEVDYPVAGVDEMSQGGMTMQPMGWELVDGVWRVYVYDNPNDFINWSVGGDVDISYFTTAEVEDDFAQSTITASVYDSDGNAVSDGTEVIFRLSGISSLAQLSATRAVTSGGDAVVTLTGGYEAEFSVCATAGGRTACVDIEVVSDPEYYGNTESSGSGTDWGTVIDDGCDTIYRDSDGSSGSIRGRRQAFGCDNKPLSFTDVLVNGKRFRTTSDGWIKFDNGVVGSNSVSLVDGDASASFNIDPDGSESRGLGSYEVC